MIRIGAGSLYGLDGNKQGRHPPQDKVDGEPRPAKISKFWRGSPNDRVVWRHFTIMVNDENDGRNHLRKIIIVFACCVFFSGCAKMKNLNQLLTLKDLADEQTRLNQHVKEEDQKFELMVDEQKAGTLDQYADKDEIIETFGKPIYVKNVIEEDVELEAWLYRYAAEFFGGEKIYLYFDNNGNLVKSEYIEEKDGEIEQETASEDGQQEI